MWLFEDEKQEGLKEPGLQMYQNGLNPISQLVQLDFHRLTASWDFQGSFLHHEP